jgi:hypothetical protein
VRLPRIVRIVRSIDPDVVWDLEMRHLPRFPTKVFSTLAALLACVCFAACASTGLREVTAAAPPPVPAATLMVEAAHALTSPNFLYWSYRGPSAIFKLRISNGKLSKKTYGVPGFGTMALAVDRKQDVLQAFGDEANSKGGFAIFNKRLNQVLETMLPSGALAVGIASDDSDNVYLIVVTGPPSSYTIQVFKRGAESPFRTIGGAQTGIDGSIALAVDQGGFIYVATQSFENSTAGIEVFSPDAKGNVKPTRVISGTSTGLAVPTALVLGGDGNIYIANQLSTACNILVFPMAGDGNIAPVRVLNSKDYGASIALDQTGQMYLGPGPFGKNTGFAVFAPGASGDDAPIGFIGRQHFDENQYPGPLVIRYPWYVP